MVWIEIGSSEGWLIASCRQNSNLPTITEAASGWLLTASFAAEATPLLAFAPEAPTNSDRIRRDLVARAHRAYGRLHAGLGCEPDGE